MSNFSFESKPKCNIKQDKKENNNVKLENGLIQNYDRNTTNYVYINENILNY